MFQDFLRRKPLPASDATDSGGLIRDITLFQLTLMGIGSTLSAGKYDPKNRNGRCLFFCCDSLLLVWRSSWRRCFHRLRNDF